MNSSTDDFSTTGNSGESSTPAVESRTALSAGRRNRELSELRATSGRGTEQADLIVIGGGITGVGIALDAASRGLNTVLLEAEDLAHGTSRWSSKLAHGGLRYLASGNVGIARRSAIERGILLSHTAPHLTRPLAQVVPVYKNSGLANSVLPGLGFIAGTVLGRMAGTGPDVLPGARILGPSAVAAFAPAVLRDGLLGGYLNWDGQLIDDARLVTAIARTAAGYGAKILTRVKVNHATGTSVEAVDTLTGEEFALSARAVVNSTGVWVGDLAEDIAVRPSRGTHLVVKAEALGNPSGALTVAVPGETNRFCFCLPAQLGRVYVGLTDVDAPGPIPAVPTPDEDEIDFLLSVVNRALAPTLSRDDILGTYSGLRPLISDRKADGTEEGRTADLSREHAIRTGASGLITITGGKLTEYRLMAEQLVDYVLAETGMTANPCRTTRLPLVGAPGSLGIPSHPGGGALPASLVDRYGLEADAVVRASLLDDPLKPVAPGVDQTRAEFSFAVTHEGALTVGDILDRRTRVGLSTADREAAEPVAEQALRAAGLST